MPWMGRPSFLHTGLHLIRWKISLCQCPERGVLHFYNYAVCGYNNNGFECQCPEWGDLHFYVQSLSQIVQKYNCVNALNGATFISTLASGNPCKSRLCGSIFPEVFQNILKKAFLKGVFWKFTICSYLTVPFLLLVYLFFLGLRSTYSTLLIG